MKFFLSCLLAIFLLGADVAVSAQPSANVPLPGQLPRWTSAGGVIFRCLFDRSSDALNSDTWPDYWTRKKGVDQGIPFPEHVSIAIVENSNPFSNYALRVDVDGGGAGAFTPKIPVRGGMSYTASVYVDAAQLVYDDVYLLLSFYGPESSNPLRTVVSESVRNTGGWRLLEIGPIVADMKGVESASIGLLVVPTTRQDFGAVVHFSNVELKESPSVTLTMPNKHHLFFDVKEIDLDCKLSGVDPEQGSISFSLEDAFGRVIAKRDIEMMIDNLPAGQFVVNPNDHWTVLYGQAVWRSLPVLSPGFYRIRIATPNAYIRRLRLPEGVFFRDPLLDAEPLTFAVLASGNFLPSGEFGWNLDGMNPDDIAEIRSLLAQSGVSRLKIPAWLPNDAAMRDRQTLNWLCDEFARQQIGLVGLLHPPPKEIRDKIKPGEINAGSVFSMAPSDWVPTLERTLQELSLIVKDWQLSTDTDRSFSTIPLFERQLAEIRKTFDKNHFGFGIGFAWNWEQEIPVRFEEVAEGAELPNEFVALTSEVPLSPNELGRYLDASAASGVRRWVSLQPLPIRTYELEDRIQDLVERMLVAKAHGAEAVFLSKPFDNRSGLFHIDGTPTELFLPWRTTASMISGKAFLGSVVLPNRSRNYNFEQTGGRAVMVVWNEKATVDKPVIESLFLSEDAEIVDLWGKRIRIEHDGRNQLVPVGPLPVFVVNLNADVVRLRQSFLVVKKTIPGYPNRKVPFPLKIRNLTQSPLAAQISIVSPNNDDWKVSPSIQSVQLDAGAEAEQRFELMLTDRANSGVQPFRFDVKTTGAEPLDFSVYDELTVGDPDLSMEFSTRLNRNGDLEIFQAFINNGETPRTYTCRLYIRGRESPSASITRQGYGRIESTYTIKKGRELLEQGVRHAMLLAQPIGGGQPIVYTIPLESPSP